MKKQGRFEAKPPVSTPRKKKNHSSRLLMTLVSSIVSMILCCTMFLGTTMAWFTDTVTSAGNQITIGELQVDVLYNGASLKGTSTPVFGGTGDTTKWRPNHFEVRELTVTNSGNLDLKYVLNFLMQTDNSNVAQYFNVYVNEGGKGSEEPTLDTIKGWKSIGKLSEVFTEGKNIFEGELLAGATTTSQTYAIALHMDPQISDSNIQGASMTLNIKLNAYQSDTPEDEMGFIGEAKTYSGEQTEPIVFGGGTLTLKDVSLTATDGPAVKLTGNTKVIIEGTTTLVGGTGGSGIYLAEGVTVDISGDTLVAKGNGGVDANGGGNGIGGKGSINIHDLDSLTAEGYGISGFGIGGAVSSITISDTTIEKAQGGYVQQNFINDTSYGKSEPEGGAAIGSSVNGAVITLDNVRIKEALGGSKSAGIGAMFHTGVTINITDSTIDKVVGGNASAGIGGSRIVSDDATAQNVTINIKNSTINAEGGQFAAGIGSGYDTYCHTPDLAPVHTINISGNSVITAKGGKYGAGIGTGYHVAGLAGKIDESVTVNATAGESRDKYTVAMAVGFGVIDHSREAGEGNNSSFDYKGTIITVATPELATASSES